ncbi:S-protein homolog 5-like [Mercurialis annua]|uniref:S-protein homolog 5-like n=1 Tax=Mercurialis annua TaxID=3986 RepID=UPI00215FDC15|nr:S-protein homolog 5-like [Mercurialis annua]
MNALISTKQYYCILLLCLLKLAVASHRDDKTHVYITNDVGKGVDLTVHCKSKNNDLGAHLLHDQQMFEFSFIPSLWGNTLFYCKFTWSGQLKWFDIYVEHKSRDDCEDCYWKIKPNGPCMQKNPEACFPWNK